VAIGALGDQAQQVLQQQGSDLHAEQQCGQQRLECGVDVGAVDAFVGRQFGLAVRRLRGQSLQVVAQHFSADVLLHGVQ